MTKKLVIAVLISLSLGGCVMVPVGGYYHGWHGGGWYHNYDYYRR